MVLSEEEITNLYRVRKTTMQMLKDRGYLIEDNEINMSKQDFIKKFGESMKREDLVINKAKIDNPANQIYVFFPEEAKVGVKAMKNYASHLHSVNANKAILVVQQKITGFADNCLKELSRMFNIEVFQEAELMFNIKEHYLVPEHQILTEEEKKTLLERYTVKENQLPRIQVHDPISKYYGLERGQVVKIIRSSDTAGRYVTYRVVI